jgi:carboxyl-terminal processing protease
LNGLVLDLRNNPGGVLNVCIAVSAAFLPNNALVVFTNGRTEDSKLRLYASREYYLRGTKEDYLTKLPRSVKTVPMVVLVNHSSASGSEIVAAALQDHKRATIVGERSFGLGTVQIILPLKGNTALKLTTARYFRPSGKPIAPDGVTPDLVLDGGPEGSLLSPTAWPEDDPAVSRASELLRDKPAAAKP